MHVDNILTICLIDAYEILALVHFIFIARLQGTADANATLQHCQRQCFSLAGDPRDDDNTPWLWRMPGGVYFGCVAALYHIISSSLRNRACFSGRLYTDVRWRPSESDMVVEKATKYPCSSAAIR